jgi:hypothetical protein
MLSLGRCGDILGCFAEMEIERWGCGMIGRLEMIHQWYERRNILFLNTSSYRVALLTSLGLKDLALPVDGIITVGQDL